MNHENWILVNLLSVYKQLGINIMEQLWRSQVCDNNRIKHP